jgi:hypothetical protein
VFGPKGELNHPLGHWGSSAAHRLAGLRVAESPQAKRRGRPPPMGWFGHPNIYLYIFLVFSFFFLDFFFFKKKNDGGILGIKRSNGLNCHNFKVWGVLSVTLETLEAKVKIGGYFRG